MSILFGKMALLAGASRGIGLAIAKTMAASGTEVIVAARSIGILKGIASKLNGRFIDLTSSNSIESAAEDVGAVDWLANVAGINFRKRFEKYSHADIGAIFQSNLFGSMHLTQRIALKMIERNACGKIINVGSLTSLIGILYISIYDSSKGAVAEWSRCLAAEWGRYNIPVNCIAPGFILTDLNRAMWQHEALQEWLKHSQPVSRPGTPEDISPIAFYLARGHSDYMTGQILAVDGGHSTTSMWPLVPDRR